MIQRRQLLRWGALASLLSVVPRPSWAVPRPLQRIAFGSCLDQRRDMGILDVIRAAGPDLMLMIGDNVYGDVRDDDPACLALQRAYDRLDAQPSFRALRRSVPMMATWDDHDYGRNDGGADWAFKEKARQRFLDFWRVARGDLRRVRDGVYTSAVFGPVGQRVQVVLLDTRYNRSALKPTDARGAAGRERYLPDDDAAKTFLGERQWAWLTDTLRQPAEVRLIVSSIQVLAAGHGWERWGNLPREKQRLLDLIHAASGTTVLLSGDRHLGALYHEHDLYDLTSSSLNKPFGDGSTEAGPNRVGDVFTAANFGQVTLDWAAKTITLDLCNSLGHSVRTQTVAIG